MEIVGEDIIVEFFGRAQVGVFAIQPVLQHGLRESRLPGTVSLRDVGADKGMVVIENRHHPPPAPGHLAHDRRRKPGTPTGLLEPLTGFGRIDGGARRPGQDDEKKHCECDSPGPRATCNHVFPPSGVSSRRSSGRSKTAPICR